MYENQNALQLWTLNKRQLGNVDDNWERLEARKTWHTASAFRFKITRMTRNRIRWVVSLNFWSRHEIRECDNQTTETKPEIYQTSSSIVCVSCFQKSKNI